MRRGEIREENEKREGLRRGDGVVEWEGERRELGSNRISSAMDIFAALLWR